MGKCRTPHPRDHAGGALVPPSDNGRDYVSRRIVLPCVHLSSVPPTCLRSTGFAAISPRSKPSRAYTSPLAAADAALPARAICARQSRGNEVEVIQVTCMLLQFIRFRFGKQKEPRLGGMAGEMNSPHCRPGDAEHRKPFRPPLGRDSRQAETSVAIGVKLRKRLCSGACTALASSRPPCPSKAPTPCHASPRRSMACGGR